MRNAQSTVTSIGWNGIAMADERIDALEKSPCVFMAVDKHCPTQYIYEIHLKTTPR